MSNQENIDRFNPDLWNKETMDLGNISELSDMINAINNYNLDLTKESHRELSKRFLNEIKKSWVNASEIDWDDVEFWNRAAFQKVLRLVKEYKGYKDLESKFVWYTKNELDLLNKFIDESKAINLETWWYVKDLYEWTKYNSIDVNSAINAIKKWVLGPNVEIGFINFINSINEYNSYINSQDPTNTKPDFVKINELKQNIKKYWKEYYKFILKWSDGEINDSQIRDLGAFMKTQLWNDYYNIINWAKNWNGVTEYTVNDNKKDVLVDKFVKNVDVMDSEEVKAFKINDVDSLLWFISDFGWVDQWQDSDWVLRAKNSKSYSWVMNRLFTGWEWAQSKIAWEVQVYKELQQKLWSWKEWLNNLKALIAELVNPEIKNNNWVILKWKNAVDYIFEHSWENQKEVKELLMKYQRVALSRVAQIRDLRALTSTNAEFDKEVTRQAGEKIWEVEEIRKKFEGKPEFQQKIHEITWLWATKWDAEELLKNWTFNMLSDPKIYAWLNVVTTRDVTIDRIVNHLWETLSETTTKTTNIKWIPHILIWLNIASLKNRFWKDGMFTAEWWIWATWALGLDWLALPIWISWKVWSTINKRNEWIDDWEVKWNWKIVWGAFLWKDLLKDGNFVPMLSADLNWNDKIDSIEMNIFKNKKLLSNMVDDKGNFDIKWIEKTKDAIQDIRDDIKNNSTFEQTLYLSVLETNLVHLERVMNQVDGKGSENIKNTIFTTWLKSVLTDYEMNLKNNNSWVNVAWLNVGYIFGVNLLAIGLNFQHVQAAYKVSSDEVLEADYTRQSKADFKKEKVKESLDKKYSSNDGFRTVEVEKWVTVIIDSDSKDNIKLDNNNKDWTKTLVSKDWRKIFVAQSSEHNSDTYSNYTIRVSNIDYKERWDVIKGEIKINPELSTMWDVEKEITTLLPGLDMKHFKNRIWDLIHWKWEKGSINEINELFKVINNFLNIPNNNTEWELKNKIWGYSKLFKWVSDLQNTIKSLDTTELTSLVNYMKKLSMRDWVISRLSPEAAKKIVLSKLKNEGDLLKVYNAERKVYKDAWFSDAAIDDLIKAKTEALFGKYKGQPLERNNLSKVVWEGQYSKALTMITSTPEWTDDSLTTIPWVDPEIYWPTEEITNKEAKNLILEKFAPYIEKHRIELNKWLAERNIQEITLEDYKNMILWQPISRIVDWNVATFNMSATSFKSFNIGFIWNECFNAWIWLLLWKLSFSYEIPWKGRVEVVETNDLWTPNSSMDQATVWVSFKINKKTNIIENEERLKKPEKPEEPEKPEKPEKPEEPEEPEEPDTWSEWEQWWWEWAEPAPEPDPELWEE